MTLALHGPLIPLLLFMTAVAAAVLLSGAGIIHLWRRRRASGPTSSLGLAEYETSEDGDVHDQRRGGAV